MAAGILRALGQVLEHFVDLDQPWFLYPFWAAVVVLVIGWIAITVRRTEAVRSTPRGKHSAESDVSA